MSADFAPVFPSAHGAADRARQTSASGILNRVWSQPLEGHARLNALVGPEPLHLQFDCADEDFEFALTSSWPQAAAAALSAPGKAHAAIHQADLVKLAETLNSMVRLYALETGSTQMHVLVEARRGIVGMPAWWDNAPCLLATFAFDTTFSEVGLFSDPMQAFAAMDMLMTPHRLLLAVGPAKPDWTEGESEETWLDADSRRIAALKRVEASISKDIARLMANTVELSQMMADAEVGGMASEESLVEGLSRVRAAVQKMRGAILGYEHRRSRKHAQKLPLEPKVETPSPTRRLRINNEVTAVLAQRQTLASTVRELQGVLKKESASAKMPLPARATFRRGLTALTTLEQAISAKPILPVGAEKPKAKSNNPVRELMNKLAEAIAPVKKEIKKLDPKKPDFGKKPKSWLSEWLDSDADDERPVRADIAKKRKIGAPAPRG